MADLLRFVNEHQQLTRRYFVELGVGAAVSTGLWPRSARGELDAPELADSLEKLESYLTLPEKFQDVSRGTPLPHSLSDVKKREFGLTRETWRLEITSDPQHPATIRKPLTKLDGTAIDFA
jgi:hypothetical protein